MYHSICFFSLLVVCWQPGRLASMYGGETVAALKWGWKLVKSDFSIGLVLAQLKINCAEWKSGLGPRIRIYY